MLEMDADKISDEKVLRLMHKRRAKSAAIPAAAREASQQWLNEHA
jgi:hypothetical protein